MGKQAYLETSSDHSGARLRCFTNGIGTLAHGWARGLHAMGNQTTSPPPLPPTAACYILRNFISINPFIFRRVHFSELGTFILGIYPSLMSGKIQSTITNILYGWPLVTWKPTSLWITRTQKHFFSTTFEKIQQLQTWSFQVGTALN